MTGWPKTTKWAAFKSGPFGARMTAMTSTYIPEAFEPKFFSPRTGVTLAYQKIEGTLPGIFWCGGYRSDMTGSKASYLAEQAAARGVSFTRFDYTGHGQSNGSLADGTISAWLQDAFDVFDTHTQGPQIVVGSSMGGWISMLLAEQRPLRVKGLVTIAAAPDFPQELYQSLSAEEKQALENDGTYNWSSDYGSPHPFRKAFFEDARIHMMLNRPIGIDCPVRLLHGKKDDVVPWEKSLRIKENLMSEDITTTWIDDGDHRLSRDADLVILNDLVTSLQRQAGGI